MAAGDPPFLPYGRQSIDDADMEAVRRVLQSDFLTSGPAVPAFEAAFAQTTKSPHSIACANGTAALRMAAHGLGLGPGDIALIPTLTFAATANAVRLTGAEVLLADVDPATALITPQTVAAAIARAPQPPKALFVVHYAGQIADMPALKALADQHDMVVVEDASHAVGAFYDAQRTQPMGCGLYAQATTFSFHPVKTIAAGEGGMVCTRDADLARAMRRFGGHGIERDPAHFTGLPAEGPWVMEVQEAGENYRMSDIHAALGLSQLGKLGGFAERRQTLVDLYDRLLAPLAPVIRPLARNGVGVPAWHLYVIQLNFAALDQTRAQVMAALKDAGIGSQVHYIPLHLQPAYAPDHDPADFPGAQAFYNAALSIPLFPAMTDQDVTRVADALTALIA